MKLIEHCLFDVSSITAITCVPTHVLATIKETRGSTEGINFYSIKSIRGEEYLTYWSESSDIVASLTDSPYAISYFIKVIKTRPINYPKKELA